MYNHSQKHAAQNCAGPAHTTVEFTHEAISRIAASEFQSGVLDAILRIELLQHCRWRKCQVDSFSGYLRVNLQPDTDSGSSMQVFVYEDEVGIAAGKGVYFNVPSDVPVPEKLGLSGFVAILVERVIQGRLRETVYSRSGTPYRWSFVLEVDGKNVSLDRTDLCAFFRCFWRHRERVDFIYSALV